MDDQEVIDQQNGGVKASGEAEGENGETGGENGGDGENGADITKHGDVNDLRREAGEEYQGKNRLFN